MPFYASSAYQEAIIEDIARFGLMDDEAIVLDTAALELAALDHPEVDLTDSIDLLGEISEAVLMRAGSAGSNVERARLLAGTLSGRFGFSGDRDSYDDPANADLIRVIARRRGLPVSLAILYVATARRIGWQAFALNTPGHVLIAIGEEEAVVTDPFNDGAFVDEQQLRSLVGIALGRPIEELAAHMQPMRNRDVLVRLLMNQASRAERAGDHDRALTLFNRITLIAPGNAHGWWDRARLELLSGDGGAARASLSAMLETTRDPEMRTHISAALDALGSIR